MWKILHQTHIQVRKTKKNVHNDNNRPLWPTGWNDSADLSRYTPVCRHVEHDTWWMDGAYGDGGSSRTVVAWRLEGERRCERCCELLRFEGETQATSAGKFFYTLPAVIDAKAWRCWDNSGCIIGTFRRVLEDARWPFDWFDCWWWIVSYRL